MDGLFLDQIKRLASARSEYLDAVDNVVRDRDPGQSSRNIPDSIRGRLNGGCPAADDRTLIALIEDHCSPRHPAEFQPRACPHDRLFSVMARGTFEKFHIPSPEAGSKGLVAGRSNTLAAGTHHLSRFGLRGRTSNPSRNTWWGFPENGRSLPGQGEQLMRELGLSDETLAEAADDRAAVVVYLPREVFGPGAHPLYKPTALDGFCPRTRFRPDHSPNEYGKTVPVAGTAGVGWPEMVTMSIPYPSLRVASVQIDVLPF